MKTAERPAADAPETGERPGARDTRTLGAAWTGAVVTAGFIAIRVTNQVGRWLQDHGHRMQVNAPPLTGNIDPRLTPSAGLAVAVGVVGVARADVEAHRLAWRRLLWAAAGTALVWSVALAAWEGVAGFTRSVASPVDYLAALPLMGSPGRFLSELVPTIARYPSHVRAHPPGLALVVFGMDAIGLRGAGWIAALEHAVGALSVPAVLIAVREVAGEARARAAAPFLAFLPAAAFWSSGDAIFLGVGAWAVALLILATGAGGRRRDLLALGGGVLAGAGLFLSYGLVLLGAVPLAVAVGRRAWRPLVFAALPIAIGFALFAVGGFWWFDGLAATRAQYAVSLARVRPYPYFLTANLAALLIALGPAVWVAVARLRDRRLWLLVGGAIVAVAIADLSGLSKAEVERIWLPFMPWIAVAAAAGFEDASARRAWLGVNVGWAIAVQALVRSPW
jgi:methylthioxylose transferase